MDREFMQARAWRVDAAAARKHDHDVVEPHLRAFGEAMHAIAASSLFKRGSP
jgi:hypothetical protein